jgi:GTP-binding protein YchF
LCHGAAGVASRTPSRVLFPGAGGAAARGASGRSPSARSRRQRIESIIGRDRGGRRSPNIIPGGTVRVGLLGLPASGKTTLFNLLTLSKAETGAFSGGKAEPHLAVIKVPDARIDQLSAIFEPKKTTYAEIAFVDMAGLPGDPAARRGQTADSFKVLRDTDALALVVRAFADPAVPHPHETVDPARDLDELTTELIFADLDLVTRRLERLVKEAKNDPKLKKEESILERVREGLEGEQTVRSLDLAPEDARAIAGFRFMTEKALLVVANTSGGAEGDVALSSAAAARGLPSMELQVASEAEIAELPEAEQAAFLADIGVTESGRARFIRRAYEILDLISFFTVGPDEVRAWTIRRGTIALHAAGKIHSDIERGFIRAEVARYEDVLAHRGMKGLKEKGLLRLEGKEYVVQDGDIAHFRFSV